MAVGSARVLCAAAQCAWLLGPGCGGGQAAPSTTAGAQSPVPGANAAPGDAAPDAGHASAPETSSSGAAGRPGPSATTVLPTPDAGQSGADAGPVVSMQPALDPNLSFDWQQTSPGRGQCQPGTYTGTFTCTYVAAGTDAATGIEITGPVVITLTQSADGEFLEISNGELNGVASLVFGFTVKLEGRLDCSTNALDATAFDGKYGFGDPSVLTLGTGGGTLSGTLDRTSSTLSGAWDLQITDGLGAGSYCDGPWTAMLSP
jgi:hypothetical protein